MSYEEDWELGSGLALDGAVATVTAVEFGPNMNIGPDATCANFTFEADGEEIEQSFSVGKNYEANRDGTELNGNGKINANTNYGILLASVMDVLSDADISPGEVIGSPKAAEGWIGTTWTFGTVSKLVRNPSTGVEKMSDKFIVTEYHGKGEETAAAPAAKKPAASTKKAGATKAAAAKKAAGPKLPAGVSQENWDWAVDIAKEFDGDHDTFIEAMMEEEDVQGSKALQKAVMAGSGAGSVWAAAGRE